MLSFTDLQRIASELTAHIRDKRFMVVMRILTFLKQKYAPAPMGWYVVAAAEAAKSGQNKVIDYLLYEFGLEIDAFDGMIVRAAAECGQKDTVLHLAKRGADLHVLDDVVFREASDELRAALVAFEPGYEWPQ